MQFHRETDKQIKESKAQACKKLNVTTKKDMEAGDIYFEGYDFPKRPLWKYGMDKGELERNENRYFCYKIMFIIKTRFFLGIHSKNREMAQRTRSNVELL